MLLVCALAVAQGAVLVPVRGSDGILVAKHNSIALEERDLRAACNNSVWALLPHPKDCSKFLMCVQGQLVEGQCPNGLYFDSVLQICNWPSEVDCGDRN